MVQVCPKCKRGNPDQAVFCYFDGIPLRQGVVAPAVIAEPGAELVFPSGRRCRTFDDVVAGCQYEWDEARTLLQKGELAKFLQRLGRTDLVRALEGLWGPNAPSRGDGQAPQDIDIALYNFLNLLPSVPGQGPKLDLQPRRLSLKKLSVGDRPQVQVTISNQGRGVLQGKVMVSEGQEWLRLSGTGGGERGGRADSQQIKTQREQQIVLRIDTRGLVGGQTYRGRLTVITNGGIAEVPVKLELSAVPFGQSPYKGANSPRELAQRMLANPKPAVALLESGEVARWFAANGWNYPVAGEPAHGVAAVQQFFESLGLSKPPPLQLSDYEVRLQCLAPQVAAGQVTLRTNSRKWVYAQIECEAPWLRVTTPSVSGPQQTQISFEVDSVTLSSDQIHQTNLVIRANGNQNYTVRVKVEVKRVSPSAASRWLRPVFVGAVFALVLRLILALPADCCARLVAEHGPGTLGYWKEMPLAEFGFLRHFVLATWWVGGLLGFLLVWKHGGGWADRLCGVVAGCGAGLTFFSVLGCLLILLDNLPRTLLHGLAAVAGDNLSPWVSTPLWIGTAGLGWAILGAGLGFLLSLFGPAGLRILGILTAPLTGLCRLCRLDTLANWFAIR